MSYCRSFVPDTYTRVNKPKLRRELRSYITRVWIVPNRGRTVRTLLPQLLKRFKMLRALRCVRIIVSVAQ